MFNSLRILLITNDPTVSDLVRMVIEAEGHLVALAVDSQEALTRLKTDGVYDAILFDTSRQPPTGQLLLSALTKSVGGPRTWIMHRPGSNPLKADAERLGIYNFLTQPVQRHDLERFLSTISHSPNSICASGPLADPSAIDKHPCYLEEISKDRYFIAASPSMKKIYSTVRLLAPVNVPVLILGESGVGKDIVASLLHKHSLRSQESYISVNCAALPSELLESELFGYEAGAFTGAIKAKPGKFELANKGSILLDEIGEMAGSMQAKLLHVLQDGHFSRLGGRTTTQVDVRVIAATNINIEKAIAEGSFREDLYYRISAFTVAIPPLRDRREEIPFLVDQLLRRYASSFHQDPVYVSPQMIEVMQEYDWPGNLRELSNVVVRIQILQDTQATIEDLRRRISSRGPKPNISAYDGEIKGDVEHMRSIVRTFKDQTESRLIKDALESSGWNRRHAAADLRISYRALLYKIQQYQLKESNVALHVSSH